MMQSAVLKLSSLRQTIAQLQGPERQTFFKIVLGTAALVLLYAFCHDMILVSVGPKHFTEYHPDYFPFENPRVLAVCFAIMASTGPGLLLGYLFYMVGRLGSLPKLSTPTLYMYVVAVILLTEIVSQSLGIMAYRLAHRNIFILPQFLYPELSPQIIYTQTTQIFCYLFALCISLAAFVHAYRKRLKIHNEVAV